MMEKNWPNDPLPSQFFKGLGHKSVSPVKKSRVKQRIRVYQIF